LVYWVTNSNQLMKYFFGLFLLLYTVTTLGQVSFPAGFRLVKGSNPLGEDDMYTNGKYSFQSHLFFRSYDEYSWNDEKFKQYVREAFGFQVSKESPRVIEPPN